jgi:hypothetical protein
VEYYRVKQFCNPVDKNGEGITKAGVHLTCYETRPRPSVNPQVITNDQFGELELDVTKQRTQICVPTKLTWVDDSNPTPTPTASPTATPKATPTFPRPSPTPTFPADDVYGMYRVKNTRGADKFEKREVTVRDIFLDEVVELKRPIRLGLPTDANSKGVKNSFHHLNCYSLKAPRFKKRYVQMSDALGNVYDLTVRKPEMLCTPSEKEVVSDDD